MSKLLVSVRSAVEAAAALAGGADLIDVKDPLRGSLGRASADLIHVVCETVRGRRPVSAALGELLSSPAPPFDHRLRYVKWGLAGCGEDRNWPERLSVAGQRLREMMPNCEPVAVAYADWEAARSPRPCAVVEFAINRQWTTFLLDTWQKDGRTLLDFMAIDGLRNLRYLCGQNRIRVAFAGSLTAKEIGRLQHLQPDWFAVRSAVCAEGKRAGVIDQDRVRELASLLKESSHGS